DNGVAPEREREAAQLLLAEIAGGMLSSTGEVIGRRFDAARDTRSALVAGAPITLGRAAADDLAAGFAGRAGVAGGGNASRFAEGRFGAERPSAEWLGGIRLERGRPVRTARPVSSRGSSALISDFSYALSADGDADTGAGGQAGWSVWGRTDSRDFSGGSDDIELDGSQSHTWLGFDRRGDGGLLAGLAYTSSSADADYSLDGFSGSIETDLTAVLPYLEIAGDNGASARITIGIGSGEATSVPTRNVETTADLSMQLLAVSGSWPMAELGNSTLSWAGDLGFSSVEAEADVVGDADAFSLDGLSSSATRLRGGVELAHNGLGRDGSVAPRVGLLLRHDGGDGLTGTGFEITAGLSVSIAGRISLELNVRSLAMHSAEEISDWGAGLMLRGGSGSGGQGFAFALGPHWGAHEDDLLQRQDAFELDRADLQRRQQRSGRGLMADFAYGLGALGGLLTPYSELRFTSGEFGSMRQIAGVKFNRGDRLELRLFTERQSQTSGRTPAQSELRLELQREF
ncbi:MAG: autotransporter outer membrane beta-barrel domain-containing protein, partial [Gammaproteobacteria bacterium AqS3]|nr:autotransporter outer membrane beta-barrel domain-containing protein [Gammaproteobacteria bacterium AqS3]